MSYLIYGTLRVRNITSFKTVDVYEKGNNTKVESLKTKCHRNELLGTDSGTTKKTGCEELAFLPHIEISQCLNSG